VKSLDRRNVVGIRDVARAAELSITTVSLVLNDKGRLSEGTRARVKAIARDLGYHANRSARTLARRNTGLLLFNVSGTHRGSLRMSDLEYFVRLLNSATQEALTRGYSLVLSPPINEAEAWRRLHVDGAILIDPVTNDPLLAEFQRRGTPVVTRGRDARGADGFCVDNDFEAATERVLQHLHQRGAERVALLIGDRRTSYSMDTCKAYEWWAHRHGYEPIIRSVGGNVTETSGSNAAIDLLESNRPPDAVYALFDRIALGVLLAARERKVRVPQDLLLVAMTESAACRNSSPPITTLSAHPEQLGKHAARMLVDLVEGRELERRKVIVGTRIMKRASTLPRA
jgi:DNA-binding LacI/PurR family transcriptional regulator